MTFKAYKDNNPPKDLEPTDYVTTPPLPSHALIDDVAITIGESSLDRESCYYALISYLKFLLDTPKEAKESHLKFYEGF